MSDDLLRCDPLGEEPLRPFAPGSVSMRLYPHNELTASEVLAELCAQARLAADGFDGVMVSEHHGGFAGYLPNPLQVSGWLLDAMPAGWAAACPTLLPLRPIAMLAEEVAWLDARHPGRVGVGVAPGALDLDFDAMEVPKDEAMPRFRTGLARLVAMLSGRELGVLEHDRALSALAGRPIPVLSTAMSPPAARRAAAAGAGLLFDGATPAERHQPVTDAYLGAGGTGPRVLIRRVWLGDPPADAFARQDEVYRSYSPAAAQQHWRDDGWLATNDPDELVAALLTAADASGADSLNLRVHAPGITPAAARQQIRALGTSVTPKLRAGLAAKPV